MANDTLHSYLQPGPYIDCDHPDVQAFARKHTQKARTPREQAVALYYAVRDGWKYNPYRISLRPESVKASSILRRTEGHCIDKAIILVASLRGVGIPARLCLAKVRNHIAVEKMMAAFGSDELAPHGYLELWLAGRWIKATPTFNAELCARLGVATLEFDGVEDAVFQQYDQAGGAFMEYLSDYGSFPDVPLERIREILHQHYPKLIHLGEEINKEKIMALISR